MKPLEWRVKEAHDHLEKVLEYLEEEEAIYIEHCGDDDDVTLPLVREAIVNVKKSIELLA